MPSQASRTRPAVARRPVPHRRRRAPPRRRPPPGPARGTRSTSARRRDRGAAPRRARAGAPAGETASGPGDRPPRRARDRRRVHGGALLLGPLTFRWTTCVRLDHLNAVGPPGSRNTVVQRNASGPTARKWSKQTGRVTTCETPSHHTRRPMAGRRNRPAVARADQSGLRWCAAVRNRPAVARADPDGRPRPIPPHPTAPNTLGGDSSRPSRTAPHPRIPAAFNDPAHHTRKTHSGTPATTFPCATERHRAPGGRRFPLFPGIARPGGWIPGGCGGILYTCSNFVVLRPPPHLRVRWAGAPRTGPARPPAPPIPLGPAPSAPLISTASSGRARGSARGDWRPWPPAGRWRRSSSG